MKASIPPDGYALIVGAMKSGTTTLYGHLARHPAVCPSKVKEPEFFSRNQGHGAGVERYEDLWDFDPDAHRYAMEASTGYTKFPMETGVPERMREHGLRPKLLYVLRDPFARIESHYNFMTRNRDWGLEPTDEHLIHVSRYYQQVERYHRVFPAGNLLLLDFDELRTDPAGLLERVCAFLGIPPIAPEESEGPRNPTRRISRVETLIRKTPVDAVLRALPSSVKSAGRTALRKLTPATPTMRLDEEQRAVVRRALADDMQELRDVCGFDVGKWGF